jgi:hypothetical protein
MDAKMIDILEMEAPWLYRCGAVATVGDGWFWILLGLSRRLEEICIQQETASRPVMVAVEAIETFGSLQFVVQDETPEAHALILIAQDLSAMTCDCCGDPGRLRQVGDCLRTRCIVHAWELSGTPATGQDDDEEA